MNYLVFTPNQDLWLETFEPHPDGDDPKPCGKIMILKDQSYAAKFLNKTQLDFSSYASEECTVKSADVLAHVYRKEITINETVALDLPPAHA